MANKRFNRRVRKKSNNRPIPGVPGAPPPITRNPDPTQNPQGGQDHAYNPQQEGETDSGGWVRTNCPEFTYVGDPNIAGETFFKCTCDMAQNILENLYGSSDLQWSTNPGWNRSRVPCDHSSANCTHTCTGASATSCAPWWAFTGIYPDAQQHCTQYGGTQTGPHCGCDNDNDGNVDPVDFWVDEWWADCNNSNCSPEEHLASAACIVGQNCHACCLGLGQCINMMENEQNNCVNPGRKGNPSYHVGFGCSYSSGDCVDEEKSDEFNPDGTGCPGKGNGVGVCSQNCRDNCLVPYCNDSNACNHEQEGPCVYDEGCGCGGCAGVAPVTVGPHCGCHDDPYCQYSAIGYCSSTISGGNCGAYCYNTSCDCSQFNPNPGGDIYGNEFRRAGTKYRKGGKFNSRKLGKKPGPGRKTHRLQIGGATPRLSNTRGGSIKHLNHGGVVKLNCKMYNGNKTECLANGCHWNFSNEVCN